MLKKGMLIITISLLVINTLAAQNLKDALGGLKTNFQIFSDSVNLDASDQIIILKADKKSYTDCQCGTGYGYGYQSFHLEFITKKQLVTKNFKFLIGRDNGDKIELVFYDANNNVLASPVFSFDIVDFYNNALIHNSPFFYSVDLVDIPIVLLSKTSKIDLIKKTAGK